jgi:hypothetical protein
MSKKPVAQFVEYEGAVYRLAGGLGTTRQEMNVTLLDKDFDSEGELQYSGTPEGGQFFFETRVKFPDGKMLPISMEIDEDSAVEIVRKLFGGGGGMERYFPAKWKSQLPESFVKRVLSDEKELPAPDAPKELSASVIAGKTVVARILPWRVVPETQVSRIDLRLHAADADKRVLSDFVGRVHRALTRRYPSARVGVALDGNAKSDTIRVADKDGEDTAEHDDRISRVVTEVWQDMHQPQETK